jgi:hypothetical protein
VAEELALVHDFGSLTPVKLGGPNSKVAATSSSPQDHGMRSGFLQFEHEAGERRADAELHRQHRT